MNWKRTLLICFLILLGGGAVTALIFTTEPTAKRSGATKQTAMLVNVLEVQRGSYRPEIKAMGTVVPSQDITLSPRVSGEITELAPSFTPGGRVKKGDRLLQIDPSDYKNALQQRRSELQQALADLKIEMGRQNVAQQDYQLLDDSLSKENRALVLREPQLNAARSRVQSARAAVDQAELDLRRTTIRAPFDAHILNRNVNVGSQVTPGDNLGRLVGLEHYWVEATVPLAKLRWITIPDGDPKRGSEVRIRNRTAWPEGQYRVGHLHKMVGTLEDETRLARVLVTVPDPLNYRKQDPEKPSLMIGSFVETRIKAKKLSGVIRLNRDFIRDNDTVWLMENGELRIVDVNIILRDAQYAYISEGLNGGDQVVTTNLSTIVEGSPLRLSSEQDTLSGES